MMVMEMLRAVWPQGLLITQAQTVADAARELADHGSTCVLLNVPRGQGAPIATIDALGAAEPMTPIIVLADDNDAELGVAAVRAGAQDYLHASELTPAALHRAVRYAVERKRSEVELSRQALHDPLTELPNRALFLDRLTVALDRSQRTGTPVCLLFLDVDTFKQVNDTLGHSAGDALLTVLADRFRGLLRPMDTVARFGGDEFTFLLEGLESEREAMLVAERISHSASQPLSIGEHELSVAVSIGISMVTDPSSSVEEVIRDADAAMYRAKELGGSRFELFDRTGPRVAGHLSLENALRRALDRDELRVHYQPRVSIEGETGLVGFEALVRWEHPERGLIAPAEFIGLAEQTGLIVPIGEWVLDEALRHVHRWRQTRAGMCISVNLSARQIAHPDLVHRIKRSIREAGADASVLWIEVSEDTVQADPGVVCAVLASLRELGVRIAIDDYGVGHSSLQSLRHLPADMLKIHESFVTALDDLEEDESGIVGAVVELGHALGLSVIAEGVETDTQLAHLRELGCDGAQGYLFSQPVSEDDVEEMLVGR